MPERSVTKAVPNILQGLTAQLAAALAVPGFNPFVATHQRHERRYTRAYADRRQKKGGGLYALEQMRVAELHPKPVPSTKARMRAKARKA